MKVGVGYKMAKKHKKQSKKWIIWILLVVLFVAVAVAVYFVGKTLIKKDEQEVKPSNETTEEVEKMPTQDDFTTPDDTDDGMPEKKTVLYEGGDPNKSPELTGVVTGSNVANGNLVIWTNIDQYLNTGTCELILQENGQKVYKDEVKIVADVSTSYCEDFVVPVSAVGAGQYQIIINLNSGDKTGIINGEVEL